MIKTGCGNFFQKGGLMKMKLFLCLFHNRRALRLSEENMKFTEKKILCENKIMNKNYLSEKLSVLLF